MYTWSYILLGIVGWVMVGSIILGAIDHNLEITHWKMRAVWWLVLLANLFWPIIAIAYLSKKSMK